MIKFNMAKKSQHGFKRHSVPVTLMKFCTVP